MRAAVLTTPQPVSNGPLEIVDLEDPIAGPDDVVVRVIACGVCRTDLQLCEGDLELATAPVVPGHQVVGVVESRGSRVRDVEIGERVGVAWIGSTCGSCRFCSSERENLCDHAEFTGWHKNGGFAELVAARSDFVYQLPDGFAAIDAAPLLCGGAIGLRALRLSGIQPGGRLGLFGFGASAACAIQIALHWTCDVFVFTRSLGEQQRARAMGARWTGAYQDTPPELLDAAITFAPAGDVVVTALRALDKGAAVAINAIHLDEVPAFDYQYLWWERQLRSIANVTRKDVSELLELAVSIPIRTSVTAYPLDEINNALRDIAAGNLNGAAVVDLGRRPT